MKEKLLLLFVGLLAVLCPASADEETKDGVTYTYTVSDDGNATITGADLGSVTDVTIPNSLGGHPVTTLKQYCFALKNIRSVTFEEGITTLDDACFMFCSALESVVLPQSITWIGNMCFENTVKLKYAVIPTSNLTHVGSDTPNVVNNIVFSGSNSKLMVVLTGKPNEALKDEQDYYNNILRLTKYNESYYDVCLPVEYLEDYEPLFSITKGNVSVFRIAKTRYSTMCLPYAVKPVGDCLGLKSFFKEKSAEEQYGLNEDKTEISFEDIPADETLTAGQPYVFEQTSGNGDQDNFVPQSQFDTEGFISFALDFNEEKAETEQNGTYLKGSFSGKSYEELSTGYCYLLQSDGVFRKVGATRVKVPAYRAYLDLGEASSQAKAISMKHGSATGIDGVCVRSSEINGNKYDLQGRRLVIPAKGQLYILNGRKYMAR